MKNPIGGIRVLSPQQASVKQRAPSRLVSKNTPIISESTRSPPFLQGKVGRQQLAEDSLPLARAFL